MKTMVERRGGRPVWLPALISWFPLLIAGAWLLMGVRLDAQEVGRGQHSMRAIIPDAAGWLWGAPFGWLGLLLFALGIAMLILYLWSPDPLRWRFVVTEFPPFRSAAWVFLFLAFLSWWDLNSHVVEATQSGLQWRFIATVRAGAWNQILTAFFFAAAVACTVAAYGRTWRVMPWPLPRRDAPGPESR